jgi:hypothetical protein
MEVTIWWCLFGSYLPPKKMFLALHDIKKTSDPIFMETIIYRLGSLDCYKSLVRRPCYAIEHSLYLSCKPGSSVIVASKLFSDAMLTVPQNQVQAQACMRQYIQFSQSQGSQKSVVFIPASFPPAVSATG